MQQFLSDLFIFFGLSLKRRRYTHYVFRDNFDCNHFVVFFFNFFYQAMILFISNRLVLFDQKLLANQVIAIKIITKHITIR